MSCSMADHPVNCQKLHEPVVDAVNPMQAAFSLSVVKSAVFYERTQDNGALER